MTAIRLAIALAVSIALVGIVASTATASFEIGTSDKVHTCEGDALATFAIPAWSYAWNAGVAYGTVNTPPVFFRGPNMGHDDIEQTPDVCDLL